MAAVDAFGTQWELGNGDGPPETFTPVAEVTNVDVLDVKVDTTDASSHDSAGQWREFIPGMKDGGELSFDINYDPALHGTIFSAIGIEKNMKIVLTDAGAAEVAFAGIVTGMKASAPYDDKLSASVTVKVNGAPTITP